MEKGKVMFTNLGPGHLGIKTDLEGAISLAARHHFGGVEFSLAQAGTLADELGIDAVQRLFTEHGVRAGHFGLGVDLRGGDAVYQQGLDRLRLLASLAPRLGCCRTATAIRSFSDTLPYREHFAWWVNRLQPVAQVLADHGCRLGLEFIGPKTKRAGASYEFIYTADQMLELARAVGPNVGLLHDCWHWYTSGGTLDEVRHLTNADVVVVHVNDAPVGIERDEQIDNQREMPMETGVIDLPGYLRALDAIGYDGPVTTEPFNARIRTLDPDAAAAETAERLRRAFGAAGVAG